MNFEVQKEIIFFLEKERENIFLLLAKNGYFFLTCSSTKIHKDMSQLIREQRYTIQVLLQEKYKNKAIAAAIGVRPTTIGREIKHNSDLRSGKYTCDLAQSKL